jgi:cell division protein FtsQ
VNGKQRVPGAVTVIVAVIALGIAAWVVVTSALFDIQKIDVRGNRRLSDGEIVRLSGARFGNNLLTMRLEKVRRSLLRSPWIASAEASRSLPSTLVLHLTERSAVAWVQGPGGYAALAGDGVVLERGTGSPEGLVSLGSTGSSTPVGRRMTGLDPQLRVTASLDPRVRQTVEEATVDGKEVELLLVGGAKVLYGEAESLKAKNAALMSMLRYARKNQIEIDYLDVRSPAAPALRPA